MIFAMLFGLSPSALPLSYAGPDVLDLKKLRGSTVAPALTLVASLAATEAVKLLTGKGEIRFAPHVFQIDLMNQKAVRKYYLFGMKSFVQRIKKKFMLGIMKGRIQEL